MTPQLGPVLARLSFAGLCTLAMEPAHLQHPSYIARLGCDPALLSSAVPHSAAGGTCWLACCRHRGAAGLHQP